MPQLNSGDYAEMAESYERQPPRRGELLGEPVLNLRIDREPDAASGEPPGD